ncbi:MAG: hypothetical protein WC379_12580 [Methanoregula sp.]|jgi:hypothetical protein
MVHNRNLKIAEMEKNFENSQRIAEYRRVSKAVILEDYKKLVSAQTDENEALMERIADEYRKKEPSTREKADSLFMAKNRYHSMTGEQLREQMRRIQAVPGLGNGDEVRALASEMRDRGAADLADGLANHIEEYNLDRPHMNDPRYKELARLNEGLKVSLAMPTGAMILNPDMKAAKEADIVTVEG